MCVHGLGQCLTHSRSYLLWCCPLYLECVIPSRNLSPSLESPLSCAVLGHLPSAPIYKHLITRWLPQADTSSLVLKRPRGQPGAQLFPPPTPP